MTEVSGVLTDANGLEVPFTGDLSGGDGPQTWTTTIARADLEALADGPLIAAGSYTSPAGTVSRAPLRLVKDVVAPAAPTATPAPGTYTEAQAITLAHGDADSATRIHYTNDGSDPTAASAVASGALWVTASQTIKAMAIDGAGNAGQVATLAYLIEPPAPAPEPPVMVAPLQASDLQVLSRRSARSVARTGLSVGFRVPANVSKARVKLLRGSKVIASKTVATPRSKFYVVRMQSPGLRRLAPGRYTLEVTPVTKGRVIKSRIGVRIGR